MTALNEALVLVFMAVVIFGTAIGLHAVTKHEPNVVWQCDPIRREIWAHAQEEVLFEQFKKTNTSTMLSFVFTHFVSSNDWHVTKGDKELGYRSDGVVVWRELPEGK